MIGLVIALVVIASFNLIFTMAHYGTSQKILRLSMRIAQKAGVDTV